ncbi:MAG: endoribonuclease YicC domain-containing protein [Thermodesulfobacteriota bacterium]|nr:MAG: DUF1732 domain-containing protein [Candidatus Dadabacteria bacterium]|tara:strand:+ start:14782 stop:15654 length:873 start_codon:yes stop_codon:yes gene_type:complete
MNNSKGLKMTRSMTGFASVNGKNNKTNFIIQLKSENSRSLDVLIYDQLNNYELQEKIKKIIKKDFERGKIRISIDYNKNNSFDNKNIGKQLNEFSNLSHKFNIKPTISIGELNDIANKEVVIEQSSDRSVNFQLKLIKKGIKDLIKSQEVEGLNLIKDISSKMNKINKIKQQIIKKTRTYKYNLEKKYKKEIVKSVEGIDPLELKRDISNALDKVDIEEEIIRLDSHISELSNILRSKGAKGLKIDFYMQEINREANTISSKSKDPKLSDLAIEIKTYLNQIRELAANLS